MTRKDYIRIARGLNAAYANVTEPRMQAGIVFAATEVALELHKENSRFNAEHFLAVVRGEKSLTSRP